MAGGRRLGRGLGSFLNFAPAGEDGAPHVVEALTDPAATSILSVSTLPPPEAPAPAPRRPAPVPPPPPPPAPPPPRVQQPVAVRETVPVQTQLVFVDEIVVTDFVEAPVAEVPPPSPPPPPPVPVRVAQAPAQAPAEPAFDDMVVGLSFPDIELE